MRTQIERNDGGLYRSLADLEWADGWIAIHIEALRAAGKPVDEAAIEAEFAADMGKITEAERRFLSCEPAARARATDEMAGSNWDDWENVPDLYEEQASIAEGAES